VREGADVLRRNPGPAAAGAARWAWRAGRVAVAIVAILRPWLKGRGLNLMRPTRVTVRPTHPSLWKQRSNHQQAQAGRAGGKRSSGSGGGAGAAGADPLGFSDTFWDAAGWVTLVAFVGGVALLAARGGAAAAKV